MKMIAKPEKCLEIRQSLSALVDPIRKEKGCMSHDIFQDIENENSFSLIQMWQTQEDMDDFMRSDLFDVMIGTRHLLSRPSECMVNEVTHSSGWEAADAVRG